MSNDKGISSCRSNNVSTIEQKHNKIRIVWQGLCIWSCVKYESQLFDCEDWRKTNGRVKRMLAVPIHVWTASKWTDKYAKRQRKSKEMIVWHCKNPYLQDKNKIFCSVSGDASEFDIFNARKQKKDEYSYAWIKKK